MRSKKKGGDRKRLPKERITLHFSPDTIEIARRGGKYHGIGYQVYMRWLMEEGLKHEADYYGWSLPSPSQIPDGPTKTQMQEIKRLVRMARRRVRRGDV